jgi:hypothetical protein
MDWIYQAQDRDQWWWGVVNTVVCFFLNSQTDAPIVHIYSVIKLHVSDIFSAHRQEFSNLYSAPVSFMQVFDDRFQAESGWNCIFILTLLSSDLTLLGNAHHKPA